MVFPGAASLILWLFLLVALCAALVLTLIARVRTSDVLLIVSAALIVLALIAAALSPVRVPPLAGMLLAAPGVAAAILGGGPVTRRALQVAAGGRVQETHDGGIQLASAVAAARAAAMRGDAPPDTGVPTVPTLLRGGAVIGYLERSAAVIALLAGYPSALAVLVALKSVGRFTELAQSEARERFIIGSLASLTWACIIGATLRLAVM